MIKKIWADIAVILVAGFPLVHSIDPKLQALILAVLAAFNIYSKTTSES